MMNRYSIVIFALAVLLLTGTVARAQTPEAGSTVTVEGQITNATTGEPAPAGLSLMVHTYDDGAMTNMIDEASDPQGRFHFEGIPVPAGRTFEMMVVYQDVAYFSQEIEPEPGQTRLELPVSVYETTTDAENVRVEQQHLLLAPSSGTMRVTQVFVLSNSGDRTVVGDGENGLRFRLPADAADVAFEGARDQERYRRAEDGFVDTGAVRPGQRTQAAVVNYSLPYEGGIELQVPVDYPTAKTTAFAPAEGVSLEASQWTAGEEMLIRDQVHQAYSYAGGSLAPGESLRIAVEGQVEPAPETSNPSPDSASLAVEETTVPDRRRSIFLAGVALSLAMIGAGGIWWWRDQRGRTEPVSAETTSEPASLETTLQAIATLDDAYGDGTVAEAQYEERRARLRDRAVKLMMAQEDG